MFGGVWRTPIQLQQLVESSHLHRSHLTEASLVGADAAKVTRVAELDEVEHVHAQLAPRLQRRRVERGHHHLPMSADGAHLRGVRRGRGRSAYAHA